MFECTFHKYCRQIGEEKRVIKIIDPASNSQWYYQISMGEQWQGDHVSRYISFIYIDLAEHGGNSHICQTSFIFKTTRTACP